LSAANCVQRLYRRIDSTTVPRDMELHWMLTHLATPTHQPQFNTPVPVMHSK